MRQRVISGTVTVLAVCIGVRVAAALVTPVLPGILTFAFVGGILLWAIGER